MSIWERLFAPKSKQPVRTNEGLVLDKVSALKPEVSQPESASPLGKGTSGGKSVLEDVLSRVEGKVRTSALPLVSLTFKTTSLGKKIVWVYRTSYNGPELDFGAAERVLMTELRPYGLKVSPPDYMGGGRGHEGEASAIFDCIEASPELSPFQEQLEQLDGLDREAALKRGADLAAAGHVDLLITWLREAKYPGIAAKVLATCGKQEAASKLIDMLQDGSSEIRQRAESALGPLGGEAAARGLCSALGRTSESYEAYTIAHALARIGWFGAKDALVEAAHRLKKSRDSGVHDAIGVALVTCCRADEGFDLLLEKVQSTGDLAVDDVAALNTVDDPRAVPVMKVLLERSVYEQNKTNAKEFLSRHTQPN